MHRFRTRLELHEHVLALTELAYPVSQFPLTPLVDFVDGTARVGDDPLHLLDDGIHLFFSGVRFHDKQLFVNAHSSFFCSASGATIELRHGLFDAVGNY